MSRKRLFIVVYLVALAASHVTRAFQPRTGALAPGYATLTVPEINNGTPTGSAITLAYRDFPATEAGAQTLVMLHGSPGSSSQVTGLAKHLAGEFRVITPDLPGFGGSTRKIADYSIDAHARYLAELLDALKIEKAHVLGFSMGGGVALEFAASSPEKTASLILLGSIGVQELELLGNYWLNRVLHGLQLAALWLAQEALPHFGALDNRMLNVSYARNFFDTDQRPLREILLSYRKPMLILHGKDDFLVPVSAAREHARLVPQSELILYEGGHFRIFTAPASLSRTIGDYLNRFEADLTKTRDIASPERVQAAVMPFDLDTHGKPRPVSIPVTILLLALPAIVISALLIAIIRFGAPLLKRGRFP